MLTGELAVVAAEYRQRDARCERRQHACVKRANPVSFEKIERNGGYVGILAPARNMLLAIWKSISNNFDIDL